MGKEKNRENLKLIYIHKIGYNYKNEVLLEFLFSDDVTNIDAVSWGWYDAPACDNAKPPTPEYVSDSFQIKLDEFDLRCFHEDSGDPYIHTYQMIQALAYETTFQGEDDDDIDYDDDKPLLVFHYGISFAKVANMLNERGVQIK